MEPMFFHNGTRRLHYEVYPGIVDSDVLMIHGNLASNRWWYPTVEVLKSLSSEGAANRGNKTGRVYLLEWVGYGQSSGPKHLDDLAMEKHAADVVAFVKYLKVPKINLVGHSTGGTIAMLSVLNAPELFHKMILLDSVGAKGYEVPPNILDMFTQMSKDKNFCKTVMAATIHGVDPENPYFLELVEDAFRVDPLVWHGTPQTLSRLNIKEEVKKIKVPTLVLHGDQDVILPLEDSKELARLIPGAQFVELKNHGHSLNVEDPKRFVDLMNNFFLVEGKT